MRGSLVALVIFYDILSYAPKQLGMERFLKMMPQVKWHPPGQQSLENISWTEAPPEGTYTVYVELFRGPKAGIFTVKRWSRIQDGWSYGMGGSFISNWDFFLKIYKSKPRSDAGYKKPSIFWKAFRFPIWERNHILNKATQLILIRIFIFSPMCGQCQWQASFQILVQSEGNTMRLFSHSNQFFDAGPRKAGWELFGGERTVEKKKWWF